VKGKVANGKVKSQKSSKSSGSKVSMQSTSKASQQSSKKADLKKVNQRSKRISKEEPTK